VPGRGREDGASDRRVASGATRGRPDGRRRAPRPLDSGGVLRLGSAPERAADRRGAGGGGVPGGDAARDVWGAGPVPRGVIDGGGVVLFRLHATRRRAGRRRARRGERGTRRVRGPSAAEPVG